MTCKSAFAATGAFTLVELIVAMGVSSLVMVGVMTTWMALQTSAINVQRHAERQNDQMRMLDYLKRDIRRATTVEIYNGASLVTGNQFGSELRLTLPDYYTDAREEDNAVGPKSAATPTLSNGNVAYGAALTVRYYVLNGALVRREDAVTRGVSDPTGSFTTSFRREATGEVRCRVRFDQTMRGGSTRILRREVDILCSQRSQLQS